MDVKPDQSISTQITSASVRPLTTSEYQNSFISGVSWGILVLFIVLLLGWLVSVMRYRRATV
jgi:hypothetical protein